MSNSSIRSLEQVPAKQLWKCEFEVEQGEQRCCFALLIPRGVLAALSEGIEEDDLAAYIARGDSFMKAVEGTGVWARVSWSTYMGVASTPLRALYLAMRRSLRPVAGTDLMPWQLFWAELPAESSKHGSFVRRFEQIVQKAQAHSGKHNAFKVDVDRCELEVLDWSFERANT